MRFLFICFCIFGTEHCNQLSLPSIKQYHSTYYRIYQRLTRRQYIISFIIAFIQQISLTGMNFFLLGQPLSQPPNAPNQIWISGQHFARNLDALRQRNIGAVCSVAAQHFSFPPEIRHISFDIEDSAEEDISSIFESAYEFIENNRKQTNVLVHCVAGISRSATVLVYYLMRRHRWKLEDSLKSLRETRPIIRPNVGFYRQLLVAEKGMGLGILRGRF